MAIQKCMTAAQQAVGRDLTDAEYEYIEKTILDLRRKTAGDAIAFEQAVNAKAEELRIAAALQRRNAALNEQARLKMVDYITSTWDGFEADGLTAILVGTQRGAKRAGLAHVDVSQKSLLAKHQLGLITELQKADALDLFSRGDLDEQIYDAIYRMDAGESLDGLQKEAVAAARAVKNVNDSLVTMANRYGANITPLPGYVAKRSHDGVKIKKDREGWNQFVTENLDWDRSFPDVPEDERAALLDRLRVRVESGVHLSRFGQGGDNDFNVGLGFANLGKRHSHDRVLHFKDWRSEFEYAKRFGRSDRISEAVLIGIDSMTRDIAIMQRLGPNAENNLRMVIDEVLKRIEAKGDPDALAKQRSGLDTVMRIYWSQVNGDSRIPGNAIVAQASSAVQNIQQASKLGGATLSSLTDIPSYASQLRYNGSGMLEGVGQAFGNLFNGLSVKEKAWRAQAFGVTYDGLTGNVMTRFDMTDEMVGWTSKIASGVFKLSGLTWWSDVHRIGFATGLSNYLAKHKDIAWSGLNADRQRNLLLYDLGEAEWEVIRKGVEKSPDGTEFLTAEAVGRLSDEDIVSYMIAADEAAITTPARIARARDDLADRVRSYYLGQSTQAIPEGNAKTRGMMIGSTRPGTFEGTLARQLMTFKTFTFTWMHKVMAREVYGRGAMTMREAMRNQNGELTGLANLMVWQTVFGYLALSAKDLAKGREPRDPTDVKTWVASMAQGGGAGIYGDFLFGDMRTRYGQGAIATLAGPTAGSFEDVVDIFQRMRDGDDAAAQAARTIINHTPFINLWYTRYALDYLILNRISETLSPGYMERQATRAMEDNGQSYFQADRMAFD